MALKQPMAITDIVIEMDGYRFGTDTLHFYPTKDPAYPDEIVLIVTHPDWTVENRDTISNGACIFLDYCLGKLRLATDVDYIQVESDQDASQPLILSARLRRYIAWR